MLNNPLVTICIPHYNNKETISETLDSILNQIYKNIIIKVFDNASTDNSMEILKDYEKRYENIQVFQNEVNIGGEANFTKCIENLEGEYGAIFHADDVYLPDMISKQVAFLEKYEECTAVSTYGYVINEESKVLGMRPIPLKFTLEKDNIIQGEFELLQDLLEYGNFITCPSVMGRVGVYKEKIRFWNGSNYKTSADLDVWLRFAEYGSFGIISEPLIMYRKSLSSFSYKDMQTRTDKNNMFLVLDAYMKKYSDFLSAKDMVRYDFLLCKDNVNRTINSMLQNKKSNFQIRCFTKDMVLIAMSSKENFKIYLIALLVKLLRKFSLPIFIREKIFHYRFQKG